MMATLIATAMAGGQRPGESKGIGIAAGMN
jgi:hypothetical protein